MSVSKSMREAWQEMGNSEWSQCESTERFVLEAIKWLTNVAPITITRIDEEGTGKAWLIESERYHSAERTLEDALCGAVLSQSHLDSVAADEACAFVNLADEGPVE